MSQWLNDVRAVTTRNIIRAKRTPDVIVFAVLQPIMFVVLFSQVFGGAINVPGTDYTNFLMAGIFAAAVLDGQEGESGDAIGDLAEAMLSDLEELVPSCQEAANLAERLEGDLRSVVSNLDRVKRPFQRWIRALEDEGTQALVEGVDAEVAP